MILIPDPMTRVNDKFVTSDVIDASPLRQDIKSSLIPGPPNQVSFRYQADFYKKFALDIVTETVFDYPYPCITEKTLRPISCKRLFIVVGPVGVLALLKSKGFETFGDFVNDDYDSIVDPCQRFNKIVNTIEKFLTMSLHEIRSYYRMNQQKFDNNLQILKNLRFLEYQKLLESVSCAQ